MDQYLIPLFWQCGESGERIRNEITQMCNKGIGGFVVESRPHPDFLGYAWWRNTDVILDQSRRLGMGVWFFDDKIYPSGYANGAAEKTRPELLKYYLDERHIDAYPWRTVPSSWPPGCGTGNGFSTWSGQGYATVLIR